MRLSAALALAAVLLLHASSALALHDADTHPLDSTAYTLRDGEFKLGVLDFGYGLFDWCTLDTYYMAWLLKVSNLSARFRIWGDRDWTVSAKTGFFYLDLQKLNKDASPVTFKIVPTELMASWRFASSLELSFGGVYTPIIVSGEGEEQDIQGAAGYSNVQALLALQWSLSQRWALVVRSRHLLQMQMDASAKAAYTVQVDDHTTVDVHGAAAAGDVLDMGFPSTFSVVPGVLYSSDVFNIEAGLGYGNMNVLGINFVSPTKSVVPLFDMYWRW
jgi:hypothetical protein